MRILYIEDEADLVPLVRRACPDCEVGTTTTLAGARYCLSQTHFDVLLVDLNLPDSHGIDTVESLKPYCLPIIVLTGDKTPEYEARCRALGVDDFLRKTDIIKSDFAARIGAVYKRYSSKWTKSFNLAFDNIDAMKPYLCSATAFATLALATTSR